MEQYEAVCSGMEQYGAAWSSYGAACSRREQCGIVWGSMKRDVRLHDILELEERIRIVGRDVLGLSL